MTAFFVTGTGTDIGKTFVTAGIIRALRGQQREVAALKPVVSGFADADAAASDPGQMLAALGLPVTSTEIARIAPWRFRAPLSPDMAAAREGRSLDVTALLDFCRAEIEARRGVLLIEGVGGVMVPLDDRRTVLDWMAALRLPVLLVAGSYLGTISHSLTAIDALRRHDLAISAFIVSESIGSTVPLDDTIASLARFTGDIPVFGLPRLSNGTLRHPTFDRVASLL